MDTFIQKMNNNIVQQKLCAEPKDWQARGIQIRRFAYEEGKHQLRKIEGETCRKKSRTSVCVLSTSEKTHTVDADWCLFKITW